MKPCLALTLLFLLGIANPASAALIEGEVTSDKINIRSDSTVASTVICTAGRGEKLEAVSKSYEWYKIRLPKNAPSFIKKEYLSMIDDKTAKVAASSVNVRLAPSESSAIIGKAKENEVVEVLGIKNGWAQIEPINNSFGWINARYFKPIEKIKREPAVKTEPQVKDEITVFGVMKNKAITRVATHKLITEDGSIFLIKGNRDSLNALDNKKAKVWGRIKHLPNQEYPLIEVTRIEAQE